MSYANPRIKDLSMTMPEAMYVLSDGNPGAITAMVESIKIAPQVDPDSALGPWGPLFALDSLDCYGSRIWMLFKDVCGQDPAKMIGVLRAIQLGIVSDKTVSAAIDGAPFDVDETVGKVRERLPAFAA